MARRACLPIRSFFGTVTVLIKSQKKYFFLFCRRKLAYEIKKKARGYYVRFDYCGLAPLVNEIERFFRIDDRALKYMTVVLDKDVDLEKVKEEKAAAESQREPEPAPPETPVTPETPEETKPAELTPEPAAEKQEETVAPEPAAEKQEEKAAAESSVAEEAPASETTESAEKTTPVEKKEEA